MTMAAVPRTKPEPEPARRPMAEPVWLVRIVLFLFLLGFAAFLGREVARLVESF